MARARPLTAGLLAILILAIAACVPTSAQTPPTPMPPATAAAFSATWCIAFAEFTAAVGNDAGDRGPEAAALHDAVESGDAVAVVAAVPAVRAHVERFGRLGRQMAAGWAPGRPFAGVVVELADLMLVRLDELRSTVDSGGSPPWSYFGEAEFALYQELFVEGRALNDRHRGSLESCS